MNRKIKSVSFNLDDQFEYELLEYSKKFSNFSSFVKRLIQNQMNGSIHQQTLSPEEPKNKLKSSSPTINKDLLKQLI